MALTVVTWNLHGSANPDLDEVARRLRAFEAELVVVQEIQRRQASGLSRRLAWHEPLWLFKHFPIVKPSEGLAVLSPHPLRSIRSLVLSRKAPWWSHRRRVAQVAEVEVDGAPWVLCNVHLDSTSESQRVAQVRRLLAEAPAGSLVAGDLNADPRSAVLQACQEAGLRDAWEDRVVSGTATNWRRGDTDAEPTQRLDYVLVPAGIDVVDAPRPVTDAGELALHRRLSDHLPVVVSVVRAA